MLYPTSNRKSNVMDTLLHWMLWILFYLHRDLFKLTMLWLNLSNTGLWWTVPSTFSKTEHLFLLPLVILPSFLDSGNLFSNTVEIWVPSAHLLMLGQKGKWRTPGRFHWDRNFESETVGKRTRNKDFQRECGQQVKKGKVVNLWVMVNKSKWREHKEVRTAKKSLCKGTKHHGRAIHKSLRCGGQKHP